MEALNGKMIKMDDEHLPPGFRFHPTDEELVSFYLSKKIVGSSFSSRAITEVDLNKCEPRDLPDGNEKEKEKEKEKELVILKSLKGKLWKSKYEAKCDEKPPQIVNVKTSPRRIQQPR